MKDKTAHTQEDPRANAFKTILKIVIFGSTLFTANGFYLYFQKGQLSVFIAASIGFLFLIASLCSLWLVSIGKFQPAVTIFVIAAAIRAAHITIVTPDNTFPIAIMYLTVFVVIGIFLSNPQKAFYWVAIGVTFALIAIPIRRFGHFTLAQIQDVTTNYFAIYALPIVCLLIISIICVYIVRQFHKSLLESRAAQKSLEQSNKMLESFAYVASHDLQAPLRSITTFAQMLERDHQKSLDPEANEYVHFIIDNAKQMQKLVKDLLQYSSLKTGEVSLQPTPMNQVLNQVLKNLKASIEETHAVINIGDLPTMPAYPGQMTQLFQNLISNAITFRSSQPPQIDISVMLKNKDHLFSVKDNGIGIQAENFEKIFEMFQRLHGQDKYSGNGIGLAIVKEIVTAHGGKIWIESEPGKGTIFFFTIPVQKS